MKASSSLSTTTIPKVVGMLELNRFIHVIEVANDLILLSFEKLSSKDFFKKAEWYQITNIPFELRKIGSAFMPVSKKGTILFKPCRFTDNFMEVVLIKTEAIAPAC